MDRDFGRIPFFRLLLPLVAGIVIQYYFYIRNWSFILLFAGLGMMLLSYFIPENRRFSFRWIFGVGSFLFLFQVGVVSTQVRQKLAEYNFLDINRSYTGLVADIPQEKPNSYVCKIELIDLNKKIICYLPKNKESSKLEAGNRILFFSEIKPFEDKSIEGEFNYTEYITNKGYSGISFIPADRWEVVDKKINNIFVIAVQYRQKILKFYQTLGLNKNEYAILSAITLGYKDALSDDLKQSFVATGTAHLLAISGMHVGLIYFVLLSFLRIIPFKPSISWIREACLIILLWTYAFIIGFPPSAVRASIMLSLYCISQMRQTKTFSINILLVAAFLMLVWNPLWLFDVGFQLSFTAVLSMLILMPILSRWLIVKNKFLRYFFGLFLVSIVAQIGTLPLCLYYFGVYPSYFFVSNMLIIPLISLIIYDAFFIFLSIILGLLIPQFATYITFVPVYLYKSLVSVTTFVLQFFEDLPFSQIQDLNISFIGSALLYCSLFFGIYFIYNRKSKTLLVCLSSFVLFIGTLIQAKLANQNSLLVSHSSQAGILQYYDGFKRSEISNVNENRMLYLNELKYFILVNDTWGTKSSSRKLDVDYLHITKGNPISLFSISKKIRIKNIILDSSLSSKSLKRYILECEKLRIPYYDVSEKGSLRIFF